MGAWVEGGGAKFLWCLKGRPTALPQFANQPTGMPVWLGCRTIPPLWRQRLAMGPGARPAVGATPAVVALLAATRAARLAAGLAAGRVGAEAAGEEAGMAGGAARWPAPQAQCMGGQAAAAIGAAMSRQRMAWHPHAPRPPARRSSRRRTASAPLLPAQAACPSAQPLHPESPAPAARAQRLQGWAHGAPPASPKSSALAATSSSRTTKRRSQRKHRLPWRCHPASRIPRHMSSQH